MVRRSHRSVRVAGLAAPLGAALVVAVITYVTARMALDLFKIPGEASAIWWPTAGAVLAIMVRCPRRWWWLLLLVFAAANAMANRPLGGPVITLSYALVNVFELLVAGLLLVNRREPKSLRLHTPAEAVRFVVAFAAAIAIGSGVIALRAAIVPGAAPVHEIVAGYATTHVLGLMAFAPLLLPGVTAWRRGVAQHVEFGIVLAATVALDVWVFVEPAVIGRAFPTVLPVIWAAIRLSPWRATTISIVTCGFAAYGTSRGIGTFQDVEAISDRQVVTQMLIATVTLTTLVLVLITRHRAQLAAHVRDSEETMRVAIRDALVGMYSIRLDEGRVGELSDVNPAFASMLGYQVPELVGKNCKVLNPPADSETEAEFDAWMREFARGHPESFRRETRLFTATGDALWVEVSATRVKPTGGPPFALVQVHDLTEREHTKSLLEMMALHDALTGLPNRRLLFERLEQMLRQSERDGRLIGLLYLDLDGFKPVNDQHGHDAGDGVLVEVAHRLTQAVRSGDTVARLGGDEFAILCPQVDSAADLDHIAGRVTTAMCEPISLPDGTLVTISISIGSAIASAMGAAIGEATGAGTAGIAGIAGDEAGVAGAAMDSAVGSADELVRRADRAMYHAKRRAAGERTVASG